MTTTPTPDAAPDGQAHDSNDAQPRDAELEQLRGELEQLRAESLRERADLDNQRKRMARELESARRFANERLLADLLPLFDSMEAGLAAAAEALDVLVEECVSASETWRDFFQPARAIYLLGRGASIASALEGALLFHETAKTPAVSMAAAHFRHGPVEVVNGEFRGVVFASQAQAADLDEALARDLRQLGARVFPIGPFAEESISWKTDGVPELFAPLLEIVPVQLAGLRLAQWNGIVPGEFRFASAVTQTETGFSKAGLSKDGLSKE